MAMQFEELDIWKQSRDLCRDIYKITNYELFIRALDNKFIPQDEFNIIYNTAHQLSKSISGFIHYLKTSEITGHKNLKPPPLPS
jgi:hypothetical protein